MIDKNAKLGMEAKFNLVDFESFEDEHLITTNSDRTIFQTRQWINFIAHTKSAEPVIAALRRDDRTLDYFTGLIKPGKINAFH